MTVSNEKILLVSNQLDMETRIARLQDFINRATEDPSLLNELGCPIELHQTRLAAMVTYADVLSLMCGICLDDSEIAEIQQMFQDALESREAPEE